MLSVEWRCGGAACRNPLSALPAANFGLLVGVPARDRHFYAHCKPQTRRLWARTQQPVAPLHANPQEQPELQRWAQSAADWELPSTDTDEEDADLFPPDGEKTPEFFLQNVLALALIVLLALSVGNICLKLVFISYSLISAAFRYTVIAMFILVLFAIFT